MRLVDQYLFGVHYNLITFPFLSKKFRPFFAFDSFMEWKYSLFTTKVCQSHSQTNYLTIAKENWLSTIIVCPKVGSQGQKTSDCHGQISVRQASWWRNNSNFIEKIDCNNRPQDIKSQKKPVLFIYKRIGSSLFLWAVDPFIGSKTPPWGRLRDWS